MTALTVTMMILICGVVWGGLVLLVVHAARSEARRNREVTSAEET